MEPHYDFEDFKAACKREHNVVVLKDALAGALTDFNLRTQSAVKQFIANNGLERPQLENSVKWRNNPDPTNPIMVDSYGFYSGPDHGYVAFFFQPKTQKWNIKSLKKNYKPDQRFFSLKEGLTGLNPALLKHNERKSRGGT